MPLTLQVVGQKAAQMGGAARKVFESSGTIGRLRTNDWVFPQEYISGRHAKIIFTNGNYFIEDTSTNGVFINSPQNRLSRGQLYELRDGDTLYIDDFEVRVTLDAESAAQDRGGPWSEPPAFGKPVSYSASMPEDPFSGDPGGAGASETDPLKLLGIQAPRTAPTGPNAASLAAKSPLSQHYRPPAASPPMSPPVSAGRAPETHPGAGMIPDDYDPFAPDEPSVRPAPRPPTAPVIDPSRASRAAASRPVSTAPSPGRAAPAAGDLPPGLRVAGRPPTIPSPAANAAPANGFETAALASAPPPARIAAGSQPASRARAKPAPFATDTPAGGPGLPPSGNFYAAGAAAVHRGTGGGGDVDFAALLAGAGIDSSRVTPELSRQFGQIMRVVVAGVMDVLRARGKIKDEFRMRMTNFKATDNNPLKFSANVEDALHNLLVKRNAAYLGPVEAFEDAFADLRNHQMAILAGMRVAYESMLAEFDPARLQEQFDREVKSGSFLSGSAKQKYWELYRNRFRDMVKDADDSFRSLFGDEFAKAYEEQLVRLRTLDPEDRK